MISAVLRRQALKPSALRYGLKSQLIRCYASFPPHSVIRMPALSPTMTAGNIGTWQKKVGDAIEAGEVLVELETDKAQMDFEFQEEGVIAKILKDAGEKDVPIGQPIAVLVEEGTDVSAFESFTLKDAGEVSGSAAPKEEKSNESKPAEEAPASEAPAPAEESTTSSSGRLETALQREANISPAAKRLALENGVSLAGLKGTGKGGKIVEEDINKAIASKAAAAPGASYEDTPISGMRNAIASRLKGSVQNNPHFYVTSRISVSKLLKLRQALNSEADGKYKISVNDFLIKAIAIASQKVPTVNSSWRDGFIRQFNTVDVSVAVATPTGLITPIVSGAESRGLESISNKVKELAKKAREGKLAPEEYQGGSICISNMGMNDAVDHFTAIINPPQAAILAVGAVKKVAVPVENEDGTTGVAWDEQIAITGSFDHKVVDGAVGAEWIKELKKFSY
ncbi:probable Dihydrolipoyllysine-residue acetyltransferase component of pyruvate dehydrogenase complex, mitochondrial [Cephalotrichum gorgonifer]|uniref:Acetyltransferase component of pyruvate dehydrogenase complex n=1 Tax=Cephalotrichum gorgonifer TaxID=2041049 RepID=A0AAE8MW03_9PEZI|nr:probable Dihydrolipoyllysine-residue acetyltransferase component of pyruvate dehydrogenase complex, mitochondrial [Cephalotrichum gorgonifer]